MLFFTLLTTINIATASDPAHYSPLQATLDRAAHVKAACTSFRDPKWPEHNALFPPDGREPNYSNRRAGNLAGRLSVCAPPKVASQAWTRISKLLYFQVFIVF